MNKILIPYQIPKHSTAEQCVFPSLLTNLPSRNCIRPLQQSYISKNRKENENELPKMIQRINSREKGTRPTFDAFQFTLSMTLPAPKLLQEYFSDIFF